MTYGEIAYKYFKEELEDELPTWSNLAPRYKLAFEFLAEGVLEEYLTKQKGEVESDCYKTRLSISRIT